MQLVWKQANTSPRLWGKMLACHAAGLLVHQELAVRPAYQIWLLFNCRQEGQQPIPSCGTVLVYSSAGTSLRRELVASSSGQSLVTCNRKGQHTTTH